MKSRVSRVYNEDRAQTLQTTVSWSLRRICSCSCPRFGSTVQPTQFFIPSDSLHESTKLVLRALKRDSIDEKTVNAEEDGCDELDDAGLLPFFQEEVT